MRPIRLAMDAFGPFIGHQTIDFRELGEHTFYLIHGPTGAGKTTILDAICFALYGTASGDERNGDRMRADLASPDDPTEVTLDFAMGSDGYRVRRRPAQSRAKRRGTGSTQEAPKAELYRRSTGLPDEDDGMVLASGASKVTEAVETLLGFKADQFRQVVVLPQGQFRRFLMADSAERQRILDVLFQTAVYHRMEDYLKRKAGQLQEEIREKQGRMTAILQGYRVETIKELSNRLAADSEQFTHCEREAANKAADLKQARDAAEQGRTTAQVLAELDAAQAQVRRLQDRREVMDSVRYQAGRARKGAEIKPLEEIAQKRAQELRNADERKNRAASDLAHAETERVKALDALKREEQNETERDQLTARLNKLAEWTGQAENLEIAANGVDQARSAHQQAVETINRLETGLEKLQSDRSQLDDEYVGVQYVAAQLPLRQKERQELADCYDRMQKWSETQAALAVAQKQSAHLSNTLDAAERKLETARFQAREARKAWEKHLAANLAQTLISGEPCPVCGSTHHPSPADTGQTAEIGESTKDDAAARVEQAEREREKSLKDWNQANAEVQSLAGRLEALAESIEEKWRTAGHKALRMAVALAARRADEAAEAEKKAKRLEARLTELVRRLDALNPELTAAKAQERAAENDLNQARVRYDERLGQLPEEYRKPGALRQAIDWNEQRRVLLAEQLAQAREAWEAADRAKTAASAAFDAANAAVQDAAERAAEQQRCLEQAITAGGFAGELDYRAACQDIARIESLERSVLEYEAAVQSAADRMKRAESLAAGLVPPDLDALAEAAAAAEQAYAQTLERRSALKAGTDSMQHALQRLGSLGEAMLALEETYRVEGRLAEVANGKNKWGMTFQRFVLGTLLDDVLYAASERLKRMSRGRFELRRTLDRTRQNAAGGLELVVQDAHTGTARPAANLSGGESFLASLSLALGLAEVVQSNGGGTRLDTMFIDEGFGSLDAETLDFSIKVLMELRQEGRQIGIISHVDELKERIDACLVVTREDRGSTARFIMK